MIKVSVIVPVYNVESYLSECLDSIINQTLKEIEIICVDDCSTDNSYIILEEYSKKDSRIKIIKHKENRGLGPARNTGIENATGEYISFIDSDDYVSLDFLENLYSTAKKFNSDIVNTLSIYRDNDEKLFNYYNMPDNISEVSIINEKVNTFEYLFMTAWNKIYSKDFLLKNDLYFMEIKSGPEDEDFYQRILVNEPRTSYNHRAIYYYRKRYNSIMGKLYLNDSILLENSINTIKLMENSISYVKSKNIYLLEFVVRRSFIIVLNRFLSITDTYYKSQFYTYMYSFCNKIFLDRNLLGYNEYIYYINIRAFSSYYDYMIFELNMKLKNCDNHFLNLIQNINDINIRLENLEANYLYLINKLAWFIPIRKWRDKFRENILQNRTEQNRTEQNRTEQNRTEQNRTEQNRTEQNTINTKSKLYKLQVILFYLV